MTEHESKFEYDFEIHHRFMDMYLICENFQQPHTNSVATGTKDDIFKL